MSSSPRQTPGTRRSLTFYLTIVKPLELQSSPSDRYTFRATLGTRDESVARIKALRADLETQWQAGRDRHSPQPAIAATPALIETLAQTVHAVLIGNDRLRIEPEGLDAILIR